MRTRWVRPCGRTSWLQWNDRFRDDVRGFLRGEPGLVPAMVQRVQGSPDLFAHGAAASLNFVTAHDGLTLHDLTAVTSDRHRSWDCGPELRMQQLKNFFTVLLLSAGTPMWVMGDEFGRSQQGHDNPYDVDGPITWVDWLGAEGVERTHRLRARTHPPAPRPPAHRLPLPRGRRRGRRLVRIALARMVCWATST